MLSSNGGEESLRQIFQRPTSPQKFVTPVRFICISVKIISIVAGCQNSSLFKKFA